MDFISGIPSSDPISRAGTTIAGGANQRPPSGVQPSGFGPTSDYAAAQRAKRTGITSLDRKDKVMDMEQENNILKEKKNLLETEVKKMETKLRRIEALMRSRGNLGGESNYDAKDLQRDLQTEFDSLKAQNEFTKEKVRKLAVIQRGLASRPATAAKPNKYAHVQGKLEVTHGKGNSQYTQLAEDLRKQLVVNEREILNLQTQLNKMNHRVSGVEGGTAGVDRIRSDIQAMFNDIRDCNTEMESLQANFAQNETIFKQSKNYTAEIQKKIRETSEANELLKMANSRLHWQTVEATDLESEIQKISEERDHLERTIRNVTAEPFMRKEGQSMQARMAELELKVKEKSRIAQGLRDEELKKSEVVTKSRAELATLTGQRDVLATQHKQATDEFKATHGKTVQSGPTGSDAMNALNNIDSKRYDQMMTDLAMGGAETSTAPAWANLPFLDRMPATSNLSDPKAILQDEIKVLQLEKSGFAQELEKAQNLLKLQTDIEKENTQYFQQEIKRLTLIEKSSSAKLEELARRADEKQKMILDVERRLQPSAAPGGSPVRKTAMGPYDDDVQSEFSAITNESEIRVDENILDFKVEDAEFYQNVMQTVPSLTDIASTAHRALITLCTLDFYNHTTETTQMGEGLKPNFQTQFSFKNKVDDFYVAFLQKQPLKMDVYISKNNAAVHMGRCEILLKDLIEREAAHVESKTPLIQNWVKVFAIGPQDAAKAIGTIKYKMRLRKPIQESMRYYREKAEIQNMTRAAQLNVGTLKPPKRMITIDIVAGHALKFKYSEVADVAPFFYYQFFTFDERYSKNSAGINPRFDDKYSYEVTFDAKAIQYFETECLELILFDDNAPISGQAPDAVAGEDMIGTCKVPLKSLVSGCSFHEKYPIMTAGNLQNAGQLEVKVSVMDLDRVPQESFSRVANDVTELHYGKEWESDLVLRIARPLAKLNVEIGLLFGVFSRGMRTCTKEDFKYCCMNRLGLKNEISDREIDLFLMGNSYFKDQSYIERDDFVTVFEDAIKQARHDTMNQEAFMQGPVGGGDFERDQTGFGYTRPNASSSQKPSLNQMTMAYNESESLQIMSDAICRGAADKVNQEVSNKGRAGHIESFVLQDTLKRMGMVPDMDANRIVNNLEHDSKVDIAKWHQFMQRALHYARDKSQALKNLKNGASRNGKTVVQRFEGQDHNKDGLLNVDGFKAALLVKELNMSSAELEEAYYLLQSQQAQGFYYRDWVMDHFPTFNKFFTLHAHQTARGDSAFTDREHAASSLHDPSQSLRIDQSITLEVDQNKLQTGKTKFENYIRQQDVNLGVIFAVLDTNSNKNIDFPEFKRKVNTMHMRLDNEEIQSIFRSMDINNDGSIAYNELVEMFSSINTAQIMRKMQKVIRESKVEPEFFFNQKCREDPTKQKLSQNDFTKMVKSLYEKVTPPEIVHIFRHFDKGNKGYVSKNDFMVTFSGDIRETQSSGGFQLGIEDIIKPLQTRTRRANVNVAQMFDKYDKNRNMRLSPEEIAEALMKDYSIRLQDDEVRSIRDYFMNKYKTKEISKTAFVDLLSTEFRSQKCDAAVARKSLYDIRGRVEVMKTTPQRLLAEHSQDGSSDEVSIRTFKIAVNSLKVLTQYNIDNLAKYLDKDNNDGFISANGFAAEVSNAYNSDFNATQKGSTMGATGRSNKWA